MRANGDDVRRLTSTESKNERSPAWSPDGRRIAYVRGSYPANVCVMNADGRGVRALTASGGDELSGLAWSRDGRRIAYAGGRSGDSHIYVVDARGRSLPTNLTYAFDEGSYSPSWSPDGARIVFERGQETWIMNADGSDAHEIFR